MICLSYPVLFLQASFKPNMDQQAKEFSFERENLRIKPNI